MSGNEKKRITLEWNYEEITFNDPPCGRKGSTRKATIAKVIFPSRSPRASLVDETDFNQQPARRIRTVGIRITAWMLLTRSFPRRSCRFDFIGGFRDADKPMEVKCRCENFAKKNLLTFHAKMNEWIILNNDTSFVQSTIDCWISSQED